MKQYSLPAGWCWACLQDIAKAGKNSIADGPFGSNLKLSDYVSEGVPVLQGKNVTNNCFRWFDIRYITIKKAESLKRSKVVCGDILIVKIGSIGYSAELTSLGGHEYAIIPANLAKVTPDPKVIDTAFLCRWLSSIDVVKFLKQNASATAQPALSLLKLKKIPVPLPPLAEQKRIAAILDKADAIRRKRKRALELADEFLRATFLDMFGDPVTNPKGWPVKPLGEMVSFLTSGSRGWARYYSNDGAIFIRIQNVKGGNLLLSDLQCVQPPATAEGLRTKVQAGDLLISITADLGRTAVVDKDTARRGAYINQHLALVRLEKSLLPEYVSAFLESQGGRQQFKRLDQVGVKSGLNFDSIRSLRIPVPPVDAQLYFVKAKATIQRAKTKVFALSDAANALFAALAQRAFRGEL